MILSDAVVHYKFMNPIAEIALYALPLILSVAGYLARRMLEKIDSELSSIKFELKEQSERLANARKDIYRLELKQDAIIKGNDILQTQYVALHKKISEIDSNIGSKLSTYSTDLSTIKNNQTLLESNYGKVIKIIEKVVNQQKK